MDGLECSEISKFKLEFSGRIDAEYYQKKYLQYQNAIEKHRIFPLSKIADFLIGPFGSAYDTETYVEQSDYRYIRGQDIKPFFLQDSFPKYMAENDYNRLSKYALAPNDILVSVVGTLGNASIIQGHELPAIFSCKSTAIKAKSVNPFYLLCYLNSKYGKSLLCRKERGAIQKGLNLDDLKTLDIPLFSDALSKNTELLIVKALDSISLAKQVYSEAEMQIETIFNSAIAAPSTNNSIKTLGESFLQSGRLDAEYYQPKYDEYASIIGHFNGGSSLIRTEFSQVKKICDRKLSSYKYVEIGDVNVSYGFATANEVATPDLPDNAKIMTKKDDLIISTVRPNRGAVAVLEDDNLLVSGAFTVLREKGTYKKEVLQVLLRLPFYRDWLLRYNVGTSYPVIKDSDVLNMPIPLFDKETQNGIAQKVKESSELRNQSTQLLEYAKQAVEIAIEQGEGVALKWLKDKVNLSV